MTAGAGTQPVPHLAVVTAHPGRLGGMEKFGRFVVRSALSAGWPVTVALSGEDIYSDLAEGQRAPLLVDRVAWLDATLAGDRRYRWPLILDRRRWFRRVRPHVALFIQSSNTPLRASVAGAWLAGAPIVITHRTLPWPMEDPPVRKHLFGLLAGWRLHRRKVVRKTWLTAKLARYVVYNSQQVRRAYETEYLYPYSKGCVIPNAAEAEPNEPHRPDRTPGTVAIGFVGRLSREKRLDILFRAAASLRTGRSVLIRLYGDGPEREPLRALANALHIADRIEWCGSVDDVRCAYRRCDLVVLCSPREASSNMVLEAMASGKPAIVTDVGGLPELVDRGRCGLCVPPGDVQALAAALARLIENDRLRADLGKEARLKARRDHDPASIAVAWLDLLRTAAGLTGPAVADSAPLAGRAIGTFDGLAAHQH